MRCSRCDMPLSPTKISCPRCGTATGAGDDRGTLSPVFAHAPFGQKQQHGYAGTAVEVEPIKYNRGPQTRNLQETPLATTPVPPQTPFPVQREEVSVSLHGQDALAFVSQPKAKWSAANIGFGLAGLCTAVACLLLLSVYAIAQTLPSNSHPSTRLAGRTTVVVQNTPGGVLSPTAISPTASAMATYPGQQYIAHAQTAAAINFSTEQATLPASTFRVGQKIYITLDVRPNGHTGAVCLLWFINATQFASYPFAINTTITTPVYSYATTYNVGTGYVEIYWENAPSCTDPNKILGGHVDFTVTA